jgi:hypothetical protein
MTLTPEAQAKLEDYIARMRSALRGSPAIEPAEVEQNVREHVEVALAGSGGAVGAERLQAVLEQLGPPERWLAEDERPAWRRVLERISSGPEDWRLAYLAFGTFALALLLLPLGIGVLLLIPAFLLSRAEAELLASRGEELGARRWLVTPAIWIVLLLVSFAALVGPVIALGDLGLRDGQLRFVSSPRAPHGSWERVRIETGYVAGVAGAWWLVLAAIFAAAVKPFRVFFLPVTASLGRKQAAVLALVGAIVGTIGAVLLFALR